MSFIEFAIGELKCGRLPWFALDVWIATLFAVIVILGSAWAGLWIGAGVSEAVRLKADICCSWLPR